MTSVFPNRDGALQAFQEAPETLHLVLCRHAHEHGNLIFVNAIDEGGVQLTYNDAWRFALRWRTHLAAHGVAAGDVVHLALKNGIDFIGAFFGTLMLGAMAAPMPPRKGAPPTLFLADLAARDLPGVRAACVVADGEATDLEWSGTIVSTIAMEDLPASAWTPFAADEDAVAVLQFTSGTSGRPKAVALTHRALLYQMTAIAAALRLEPRVDHAVSWLPLFHDMGLIGFLLTPMWIGGRVALMQTENFIAHPWRWFDAIAQTGATITGAPPSAWWLAARFAAPARIARTPLNTLRAALVGAERIDAAVMAKVCERLAPTGFRPSALVPAYGMAEIGLAASIVPPGSGVRTRRPLGFNAAGEDVVSCGPPVTGTQVRIVDETGSSLPDGTVGQVEIATPSVMLGYFGDPVRTGAVLQQEWFRTGDRGGLGSSELHIIGRSDDQIIIAGQNYMPESFEQLVADVPSLSGARAIAFGVRDGASATERAVLLVERRLRDPLMLKLLRDAASARELPLGIVKLVPPGTIELTRNGKLPRIRLRARFMSNPFEFDNVE